jgi:uncharacterized membrane protein YphA (DoxX/SURF4 family)
MESVLFLLRLVGAVVLLSFGIHQWKHPKEWVMAIPKEIVAVLPKDPESFMKMHATVNIVLGVWLLTGFLVKVSAGVAALWMGGIVFLLAYDFQQNWQIMVRDLGITFALLALFLLA